MIKKSEKSTTGTSFYENTVSTTANKLTEIFGECEYCSSDKVIYLWNLEDENGDVFTIYDYKSYNGLGFDDVYPFHIGAHSEKISEKVKIELEKLINN